MPRLQHRAVPGVTWGQLPSAVRRSEAPQWERKQLLKNRYGRASVGVVLLILLAGMVSNAQTVSEDRVKAAYLYNFAKFVEWPAEKFASPAAPFQLCVLDDTVFQAELTRIVQGKTIAGRAVKVVPVESADEAGDCHALFVNPSRDAQVQHIVEALSRRSVLTVGETKNFCEEGGIVNFVLQDDRVQFEVNHKAANAAGLRISSRLLSVAKLVFE
jgi:YfiR/HmsC-like